MVDALARHWKVLARCALLLLLGLMPHSGFVAVPIGVVATCFLAYRCYQSRKDVLLRRPRLVTLLLVLSTVCVVSGRHAWLAVDVRHNANTLVADIEAYKSTHGKFPDELASLGTWSEARLRSELGMGGYLFADGRPIVSYASTYIIFETWRYDFDARRWVYEAH
jgi:hypothetical protein